MITKDNVLRTIATLKESTSDIDAALYSVCRVYNFVSILLKENEELENKVSNLEEMVTYQNDKKVGYRTRLLETLSKVECLENKVARLQEQIDSQKNFGGWYDKYQEVLSDMATLAYEHEDQEKYVGTLRQLNDKCREEILELQEILSNVRNTRDRWEFLYNEEKREHKKTQRTLQEECEKHEKTKKHNEYLVRLASKRLNDILKLQESRRWADQQYYRLKTNLRIELEKQGFTVLLAQFENNGIL